MRQDKSYHGASSYIVYQEACKVAATDASKRVRDEGLSIRQAAKDMSATLFNDDGISISRNRCIIHIKSTIATGYNGVSPQKPGGQALPSFIEKSIANKVKRLREQRFTVFPDDVMAWAAIEIKGT
jgi:hypothetical protein